MTLRTITSAAVVAMVADSKSRQVGDYVQPVLLGHEVDGVFVPISERRHLRVVSRTEHPSRPPFGGVSVQYIGVDVQDDAFEFWPSDDPRPSTEAEWREEQPL